ncbi:VpaChn25_0724 family phage protein [Desulfopila inferna]|uniref:VpaChn25_0724 family phage protein n=1 Tax=Desulfopila inferna TaxID=468528 RepID=UPI0019647BCD|nr:ArsR family transcriptional regulator [Desulfopila inferna]MBM9605955.1 ArsR family transcriptional regulator [Desulfopila inferna]
MGNFAKLVQEDMRLVVVRVLAEDADYSHNEHVLRSALRSLGHTVSMDKLRTELSWLAEQGLISASAPAGVMVAKLTARGLDVATGAVVIPGVKRPEPEL